MNDNLINHTYLVRISRVFLALGVTSFVYLWFQVLIVFLMLVLKPLFELIKIFVKLPLLLFERKLVKLLDRELRIIIIILILVSVEF